MELRKTMASAWAPFAVAAAIQLLFAGYVKDDAYIECRYALNFARGHGLVFNVGETPVEGITSFAWTLWLALWAYLHAPILAMAKITSAAAVLGVVWLVGAHARLRGADPQIARWLAATNATLLVFGQSGMEQAACACAVAAGAYAFERGGWGNALGFIALAVGATLRPEVHLLVALAAPLALLPGRRVRGAVGLVAAALLLGGVHWARWRIYGSLVPNTALVKAASIDVRAGLHSLGEVALTSLLGVSMVLAVDEARRRRDAVALFGAAALIGFAIYVVRVGRDEMSLGRLYLPVAPLAFVLAAPRFPSLPRYSLAACALVGLGFTFGHLRNWSYVAVGTRSYAAMAETMRARGRPGDWAVFQDLGRTPFEAMELKFVDPIGLVDRPIAEVYYRERANPFVRPPSFDGQAAIRELLFARRPRFFAFVAYVPKELRADVERRFAAGERRSLLEPFLVGNYYHVGTESDARFRAGYHYVDAWQRLPGYYLLLYEANP
jgi:hypothetical protein